LRQPGKVRTGPLVNDRNRHSGGAQTVGGEASHLKALQVVPDPGLKACITKHPAC
jgi:hypothetical protein